MDESRRTILFLNIGHALDHLVMLIFPTVVIAIAPGFGRSYGEMLALSFGGFLAFGAGSLPAGWLGDRWSRQGMITVFFIGSGVAAILTGLARTPLEIAAGLTLIGLFAAIYHPVGLALLVQGQEKVGRVLGINGVWGNLGVASAALSAGALADLVHWRAAFIVPGVLAITLGIAFALLVPRGRKLPATRRPAASSLDNRVVARIFFVLLVATICGGIIFNATTVAMPKVFDERLKALTDSSTVGIGAFVSLVYVFAAIAQLIVGFLIDRFSLRRVFVAIAAFQAPLLLLAGTLENAALLAVAVTMMFFIFGQIPINDAMVARYASEAWRSRVFAVRYVVSLGVSSLSVPLVAWLHDASGGFGMVFAVLAVLALPIVAAALCFPAIRAMPRPAAAGQPATVRP